MFNNIFRCASQEEERTVEGEDNAIDDGHAPADSASKAKQGGWELIDSELFLLSNATKSE